MASQSRHEEQVVVSLQKYLRLEADAKAYAATARRLKWLEETYEFRVHEEVEKVVERKLSWNRKMLRRLIQENRRDPVLRDMQVQIYLLREELDEERGRLKVWKDRAHIAEAKLKGYESPSVEARQGDRAGHYAVGAFHFVFGALVGVLSFLAS